MTGVTDRYPWLIEPWQQLTRRLDRMPHAILLAGPVGLGKNQFAIDLAGTLLCTESQDDNPCGKCKSCKLFSAKTHPDIRIITLLEEAKSISIDQIREITSYLALTPHTADCKILILTPAEAMTLQAANSLLKQLEEPPGNSILILVSPAPHQLPQTIRSRCARIEIKAPPVEEATLWLANQKLSQEDITVVLSAAGGAPLAALSLAQHGYIDTRQSLLEQLLAISNGGTPLRCAEQWQKTGTELALRWFYGFLLDILKLALGARELENLATTKFTSAVSTAANRMPANKVTELLEAVNEARQLIATPVEQRLLLEDILIRWNKVYA
ncbi:MAG: DNA polymerase III subunit delta' [Acidiferrobacterales bacterium]